ncbi:MAG: hypothetical protein KF691_09640 [Phycisphaeraceae bacterium]|nr:hypothetical protein [Phycisphaeraceae bacterium]
MLLFWLIKFTYSLVTGMAFWFGEPAPSRRYVAEYNAEMLALPESETAWRIVRQAALRPVPLIEGAKYPEMGIQATVPEDPLWPAMVRAVEAKKASIELAFKAAERSRMGMPLVVFEEAATPPAKWEMLDHVDPKASPSPLEVSLQPLGRIRGWSRELAMDCRIAAEAGDSGRVMRDLLVMQKLAGLTRDPPLLICQLVDFAVCGLVARESGYVLASYPGLLDRGQLDTLAAELKRTRNRLRVELDWEWAIFLDWIGRVYSDDGKGNGVVTYSGLTEMESGGERPTWRRAFGLALTVLLGVDFSGVNGSKRDLLERLDSARTALERDVETKPWSRTSWAIDQVIREDGADMKQVGDFLLAVSMPGLKKAVEEWNSVTNRIDVAILVTELERYRLEHGDYPRALGDLQQWDRETAPLDLMDGNPVRYQYREGQLPLVYSIGVDRVDDAGRAAEDNLRAGWLSSKSKWESGSEWEKDRLRGDCVYWPPVTVQWLDEGEKPFVPRRPLRKP